MGMIKIGRWYNGDIEGKFWVCVQSSGDASHFGGQEIEPNYVEYYFGTDDMEDIDAGIKECRAKLRGHKTKLDDFFKEKNMYNNVELANVLGVTEDKFTTLIKNYARLELGLKIKKCVEDNGECKFEAEL